jgi:hypothetical protein
LATCKQDQTLAREEGNQLWQHNFLAIPKPVHLLVFVQAPPEQLSLPTFFVLLRAKTFLETALALRRYCQSVKIATDHKLNPAIRQLRQFEWLADGLANMGYTQGRVFISACYCEVVELAIWELLHFVPILHFNILEILEY